MADFMSGLQFGTVSDVQVGAGKLPRVRVRLPLYNNVRTMFLSVLVPKTHQDKCFWMPDIGEHVAILLDDDGVAGVVLGAIYSDGDLPPTNDANLFMTQFADGTILQYDRTAHKLTATVLGDVVIAATGNASVSAGGSLDLSGKTVTINGAIVLNGKVQIKDMLHVAGKSTFDSDIVSAGRITDADGDGGA
jgi:phage baseplate assembly protein V